MTRAAWAKHAIACPWQAPGRRCNWAHTTMYGDGRPQPKCRERNCASIDPERNPYAALYRQLRAYHSPAGAAQGTP